MEYVIALVVLSALVLAVIVRPLLGSAAEAEGSSELRAELDAAKEAKYREIRDAELDFRTGKLSPEDFRRTDRELRAHAIEILRRLDELG